MRHKKKKPPAQATRAALSKRHSLAAIDDFEDKPIESYRQDIKAAADRVIDELISNGAVFSIPERVDGLRAFIYSLPRGGDRARCRSIIQATKRDNKLWGVFLDIVMMLTDQKRKAS